MKQRKKRPVPPPPPMPASQDHDQEKNPEEQAAPPGVNPPFIDSDDPEYQARHRLAQGLALQALEEGFVLLKNTGLLPLTPGTRLNVFGRHAGDVLDTEVWSRNGLEVNRELLQVYAAYSTKDAGYTGSGYDEETGRYVPQNRTSTGMFPGNDHLDPEPFIGYDVFNEDGSVRVAGLPADLLERVRTFSDTAVIVLSRHAGEGADHEKGDEGLSEGEAAMLSWCTANFEKVIVILAANSVIDGDFLVQDTVQKFYQYTYGGGVYSNNIGHEILADYDSRVELRYVDETGAPAPHIYPIRADHIGGVLYTCNEPGDRCAEALAAILTGQVSPSGRLMDEVVYDYDDNPVSLSYGGLVFSRASTTEDLYIYGHNYVAYKEGVYLGYKYFETFCPERVVWPFGYGLGYTDFQWNVGSLQTGINQYGELQFSVNVTVTNTGGMAGKDVVQIYVTAPYDPDSRYHLEKPLVSLAAFAKTQTLQPGETGCVTLRWNARDIACYSDTAQCYVLEAGSYRFQIAADAQAAHRTPAASLQWETAEDILFLADEVTGMPYRNLFTGSDENGWRYDARGTEKENIVYLHRIDVDGRPTVAPGTYPENVVVDPITRETTQILDLETRGLDSYYEMDATAVHLYPDDIPVPTTNAVYRDADGKQRNFMLQDVNRLLMDRESPAWHNPAVLEQQTGIHVEHWTKETDDLVWDHFLDQLSVNDMLCRFYHCGFDIPSLPEYGVPVTYSADTPGLIGANNKNKMLRTTRHNDTVLACTFNTALCEEFGLALAREAAASGEDGTTFFYAPGNNLHRSCLSGKNSNYFSEDAFLAGQICGYYLKGLEAGGVNGCLKHFACNDQEISREGLVVFSTEQALRELYFAAFEHALKIGGGQGIMTSLGRVGTVNACGNTHLTQDLLRKEWGFDGMLITDGYGVTSYMYDINCMLGASSGLLCFGNSGNFGECRDYMELYRYYLAYPGRTITALRTFMKGSLHAVLCSHTFRDLYTDYDYYSSEDADLSTDINWFEAQIALGCEYHQADRLTYNGIKLQDGETNPPSMMPNNNCKDRGGTIAVDDYGLQPVTLTVRPGEIVAIPVSMQKCAGLSRLGFSVTFDPAVFRFREIRLEDSILTAAGYSCTAVESRQGADICFTTDGNVCSTPCGKLFDLILEAVPEASAGASAVHLLPLLDAEGRLSDSFLDRQGHEVSWTLTDQTGKYTIGSGWTGVYQSVESAEWWADANMDTTNDLADLTLLSGTVTVTA